MYNIKKIYNEFVGKKILITGAAGNIGTFLSVSLGLIGAELILIDNSKKKTNQLITQLKKNNINNYSIYLCDIEIEKKRNDLINRVYNDLPNIDVLINNAAFVGKSNLRGWNTKLANQNINTWRRAFEVNVTAPFHFCKLFQRLLNESKQPCIINIGSIYGELGPKWHLYKNTNMGNPAAYSASKAALFQLTRWLASTMQPNIRVNSISLGGVLDNQPNIFIKRYKKEVLLNRLARTDDIIGAVLLLSSSMSSYINGQSIKVDGGWSI